MFYYVFFGKRIILTAHNVNMRKRDGRDNWLNRFPWESSIGFATIFWCIPRR